MMRGRDWDIACDQILPSYMCVYVSVCECVCVCVFGDSRPALCVYTDAHKGSCA